MVSPLLWRNGTLVTLTGMLRLERYTFPSEARFFDLDFARHAYERAVRRHLKNGTTMASYFATIHLEATKVLVDVVRTVGQRAFIGKVNMDRNSPDFYIEETARGVEAAEDFIRYVLGMTDVGREALEMIDAQCSLTSAKPRSFGEIAGSVRQRRAYSLASSSSLTTLEDSLEPIPEDEELAVRTSTTDFCMSASDPSNSDDSDVDTLLAAPLPLQKRFVSDSGVDLLNKTETPLVMPVITPRFVPTCSEDMMHSLGELSHKYGLSVQSHLSESPNEIAWVKELHPECHVYAQVYQQHGLLHDRCYMAHCCHADAKERDLLRSTGAG
jgi:cytosine/adenosine deaminase-related metal-dependent hydrolase